MPSSPATTSQTLAPHSGSGGGGLCRAFWGRNLGWMLPFLPRCALWSLSKLCFLGQTLSVCPPAEASFIPMPFPQSPEEAKKEATGQGSKSERRLRSTQSILPDKEIQ